MGFKGFKVAVSGGSKKNNNAIITPDISNATIIPNRNEFLDFLCIGFDAIFYSSLYLHLYAIFFNFTSFFY